MIPIVTVLTDASETKSFSSAYDIVFAEGGDDIISGGGGDDTLLGNDGGDTLRGGADNDTLYGEDDYDTLSGNSGNDILYGGAGWDTLEGGSGLDTLWGGDDIYQDTVSYENATSAVNVDLALGEGYMTGLGKAADLDTLHEIGSIEGSGYGDELKGDGAFNYIRGGGGGDTISGRGGDDQLFGEKGADKMYGEAGLDEFDLESGDVAAGETIDGGTGTDTIQMAGGGTFDFRGADLVSIEALEAGVNSAVGAVYMYGEHFSAGHVAANAKFSDAPVSATMNIQMHNAATLDMSGLVFDDWNGYTTVTGDSTGETVTGTARGETILGKGGADTLKGGGGDDTIAGGLGDDIMVGGAGSHDTVSYVDIAAVVKVNLGLTTKQNTGGGGFDVIAGFEWLAGSEYGDELIGSSGNNRIYGNGGYDLVTGGAGADDLSGGNGLDTVIYTASAAAVTVNLLTGAVSGGDAAGDTITGFEGVTGSGFADTLTGNNADNVLEGQGGGDAMNGLSGNDTASYTLSQASVKAALDATLVAVGDAVGDTFMEIENLIGTDVEGAGDQLRGDGAANTLTGLQGDDMLQGRNGDDDLIGGLGVDTLIGGQGVDTFRWFATGEGGDKVSDFNGAFDFLAFYGYYFGGLAAGAALTASQFVASAAPAASGAGGQFLYETDTGILSWDENGAGAGGATVIATLTGNPVVAIDDFQIFW